MSPAVVAVRNTRARLLKSLRRSLFPLIFVLLSAIVCFPIPDFLSLDIRDRCPFLIRMSRMLILIFFIYLLGFYVFGQAASMAITTQAAPVSLKAARQVGEANVPFVHAFPPHSFPFCISDFFIDH